MRNCWTRQTTTTVRFGAVASSPSPVVRLPASYAPALIFTDRLSVMPCDNCKALVPQPSCSGGPGIRCQKCTYNNVTCLWDGKPAHATRPVITYDHEAICVTGSMLWRAPSTVDSLGDEAAAENSEYVWERPLSSECTSVAVGIDSASLSQI